MKFKNVSFALAVVFCVATASAQLTGSGTSHTIPLWTGTQTLGNSPIVSAGGDVAIGTTTPNGKFTVVSTNPTTNAISGSANATSGIAAGVYGTTSSSSEFAVAVAGFATATTGTRHIRGIRPIQLAERNRCARQRSFHRSRSGRGCCGIHKITVAPVCLAEQSPQQVSISGCKALVSAAEAWACKARHRMSQWRDSIKSAPHLAP